MKTTQNINQNISGKRAEIRIGLIIAGILTAIICVMALVYEVRTEDKEAFNSLHPSHIVQTNFIGKTINTIAVSATGPF